MAAASPRTSFDGSVLSEEVHRLEADNKLLSRQLDELRKQHKLDASSLRESEKALQVQSKIAAKAKEANERLTDEVSELRRQSSTPRAVKPQVKYSNCPPCAKPCLPYRSHHPVMLPAHSNTLPV